jgi:hypothetical protein
LPANLRQSLSIGRTVGGIAKVGGGLISKWRQHGGFLPVGANLDKS